MGLFDIFSSKEKRTAKAAGKELKKRRRLARETEAMKPRIAYYETKAKLKRAKQRGGSRLPNLPLPLVTVGRIKRKKQGRKLSHKSRIRLI